MAFHDNEVPRILKVALKDTCLSGVMTLPKKFSEYTARIPARVQIILKDGFEWDVNFWKERNSLHGLKALLEYYGCTTGAFLLMEYNGGGRFVCDIFHAYEGCEKWTDECDLLGKYIMKIVVYQGDDFDELFLSDRVLEKFEKAIPNTVMLRIKNGKEYVAKYRRNENKLTGFKQIQDEIEIKFGDVVILSCCDDAVYTVSVFGPDGMEKIPRSAEIVKGDVVYKFEISVKPSHLQQYSQGVMVPMKFKDITDGWKPFELIEVTDGIRRWKIQIKKRNSSTELHRGWEIMWKDLELKAGDTCVFESYGSKSKFHVRVLYWVS